ncbi:MAG: CHASE2 domain-containing protein [Bacteroidota bacterium]
MRTILFIIISFALLGQNCSGQIEKNIVILTVKDDRIELMNVLSFLRASNSKLTCLNVNLSNCNQDSIDSQLSEELHKFDSLVVPSKVRPYGTGKYRDIRLLCSYFYSNGQKDGFVNLISSDYLNQVEKFKTKNIYRSENFFSGEIVEIIRYHFAVNIAFAINAEKTKKFIESNSDTVKIDFSRKREFETCSFDQFVEGKIDKKILEGRVVVIATSLPSDYLLVPSHEGKIGEFRKMSTSEIFANIACQIIGE